MRRPWTASTAAALAAAAVVVASASTAPATPASPPLRIIATPSSRGGSKSFFEAENGSPPSPAPVGLLWAPLSDRSGFRFSSPLGGVHISLDDDDDDDEDGDDSGDATKIRVKPYKKHWNIKLPFKASHNEDSDDSDDSDVWQRPFYARRLNRQAIGLTVDVSARTFVRAMSSEEVDDDDDKLVAKVVVRGDSQAVVDAAVEVVAASDANGSIAFRVQQSVSGSSASPISGRILIQVLVNTNGFSLASANVSGSSVVVVEDSLNRRGLLTGSTAWTWTASGESTLLMNLQQSVMTSSLVVAASGSSTLVVQSVATVVAADLQLHHSDRATLAVIAQRITATRISSSVHNVDMNGGRACVHTVAQSAATFVSAEISGDGALLEWSTENRLRVACELINVSIHGRSARVDAGAIQCAVANATVDGRGSEAVVSAREQLIYSISPDATVTYTQEPTAIFGKGPASKATAQHGDEPQSMCSIRMLAEQFPLPLERAVLVTIPPSQKVSAVERESLPESDHVSAETVSKPTEVTIPAVAPVASTATSSGAASSAEATASASATASDDAGSNAVNDGSTFVTGSLHMLGSIPYFDAIVVLLASAWILHHLLQCYDRRQRRRQYTPLAEIGRGVVNDDRVWI